MELSRLDEQLLILRKRAGMTVPQFAKLIDMNSGTLQYRLNHISTFRLSELLRIEKVGKKYGLSVLQALVA